MTKEAKRNVVGFFIIWGFVIIVGVIYGMLNREWWPVGGGLIAFPFCIIIFWPEALFSVLKALVNILKKRKANQRTGNPEEND